MAMKRAVIVLAVPALVILAACHPASHPEKAQGEVKSEATTTSSSTTTTTAMTGTTAVPAGRVVAGGLQNCVPYAVPEGAGGSAGPESLRMVSTRKGFAVNDTSVLVTDDGRTWTTRYSDTEPMYAIDATDADHAWAVGRHVVVATSDGGRTWQPAPEPEAGLLSALDFIDPQTGWGIAGGHVVRTVDGGRTWRTVDSPCGGEAVCFTAPGDGWAAAGSYVYRSTDGGDSWTPAFTAPGGGVDDPFNPKSVHVRQLRCTPSQVAWVYFAGAGSGGHISYAAYRGTAAGQWTPVIREAVAGPLSVQAPAGGTYPGPMDALDGDSAVFTAYSPLARPPDELNLRFATAGGRTLGPPRPVQGLFSVTALSFLTPDVGWAIGAKGGSAPVNAIVATTDGGQTWQEQYTYQFPPPSG